MSAALLRAARATPTRCAGELTPPRCVTAALTELCGFGVSVCCACGVCSVFDTAAHPSCGCVAVAALRLQSLRRGGGADARARLPPPRASKGAGKKAPEPADETPPAVVVRRRPRRPCETLPAVKPDAPDAELQVALRAERWRPRAPHMPMSSVDKVLARRAMLGRGLAHDGNRLICCNCSATPCAPGCPEREVSHKQQVTYEWLVAERDGCVTRERFNAYRQRH